MGIPVLIVEDDATMRAALAEAMRGAGFTLAGSFGSGEAALAAVREPAEVALVDLELPGISGIETIRRLRAVRPELRAMVLSVVEDPARIVAAFEAGATGYLLKGVPLAEIATAVRQVRDGLAPISPAVARHIVTTLQRRQSAPAPDRELTTREREILALLVGGHSYATVATGLRISLGTVQSHVKNIYRKLEVNSKAEAVGVALTEGLLPPKR